MKILRCLLSSLFYSGSSTNSRREGARHLLGSRRSRHDPPDPSMRLCPDLLVFAAAFIAPTLGFSEPLSTPLIPAALQIDWTLSGIPGGIPNRTTIYQTIQASSYGNGTTDATAAIQSALNSCPPGEVVLLSPGTFLINTSLTIPSNVTLRGAGPASVGGTNVSSTSTTLNCTGSTTGAINFGNGTQPDISGSVTITGGLTQGSTSITVSNSSGVTRGMYLLITQLNDPSFVTIDGAEGASTWSDGGIGWNGTRVLGQTVQVTSVSGSTIGITPLYYAYSSSLSPEATPYSMGCTMAGLEDLTVYANNTGYSAMEGMECTQYCWILNVENNYSDGDHVDIDWSYRDEVRHCNFHDAYLHSPGQSDSDLDLRNKSSGCLIIDNIFVRLHCGIMMEWGAAGNVVAYNYVAGEFDAGSTNVTMPGITTHGPHPFFNLIEGNIAPQFYFDDIWGSSSNNVCLRNWITGTSQIQDPLTGRGPLTGIPWWSCQADYAVDVDLNNTSYSFLGNCVGSPQLLVVAACNSGGSGTLPFTALIVAPTSRSYDAIAYGYTFGYQGLSDDGTTPGDSAVPYTTSIIAGDYNYAGGGNVTWYNATSQSIPNSLFLTGAPSDFGNLPWPPINPSNPPQTSTATSTIIPAGYRFVYGVDPTGAPSPTPAETPPSPPSDLRITS